MRFQTVVALSFVVLAVGCIPPPTSTSSSSSGGSATPKSSAPQATERVVAEAGVGKKGRSLDEETGIVVEPVKQLFAFEQKAVFDFQIKPALELYKGEHGFYPKTHEEFIEKIIKANNLKLPELPEGQTYVFDPKEAKLMVERPVQ